MTMGIGIFTESSNIPQEVCQFRSAPAERMEAEKLNKTLTEGKGCGSEGGRRDIFSWTNPHITSGWPS